VRCKRCKATQHRKWQLARIRKIRATDPVYVELEKRAVRKRMRIRRAALHALGLSNRGKKPSSERYRKIAKAMTGRYHVPPFRCYKCGEEGNMSISDSIRRSIAAGDAAGAVLTEVWISDLAARDLSRELAQLQMDMSNAQTAEDIYQSMIGGSAKFMDRTVVVAEEGPHDPDAG
jgi:hypothetical protein